MGIECKHHKITPCHPHDSLILLFEAEKQTHIQERDITHIQERDITTSKHHTYKMKQQTNPPPQSSQPVYNYMVGMPPKWCYTLKKANGERVGVYYNKNLMEVTTMVGLKFPDDKGFKTWCFDLSKFFKKQQV